MQKSEGGGSSYFVPLDLGKDELLTGGSSGQAKLNKALLEMQRQGSENFLNVYFKSPLLTHNL